MTRMSIRDSLFLDSEGRRDRGWAASQSKPSVSVPENAIGGADTNSRHPLGDILGSSRQAFALVTIAASLMGPNVVAAAHFPPGEELCVAAVAQQLPPPSFFQTVPDAALDTATLALAAALPSSPRPSATAPYTGPLVDTTDAAVVALDAGVTYRDLKEGDGAVAAAGRRVNVQWVLKRSNGYSIDSSAQNDGVPFIFVVGGGQAIPGLDAGVRGMAVGGIRRLVIPPAQAYRGNLDDPNAPGPVPPGFGPKQRIRRVMENRMDVPDESFLLDIKLTRVQ